MTKAVVATKSQSDPECVMGEQSKDATVSYTCSAPVNLIITVSFY